MGGPGSGTPLIPLPPKRDPAELAQTLLDTMLSTGGSLLTNNREKRPCGPGDSRMLARLTGETIDQFNQRLADKLMVIEDDIVAVIKKKLANDEFKSGELGFLFSVMHDKRRQMNGAQQVNGASINIQINQHGTQLSKDDLIAMLEGRKAPLPAQEQVTELAPVEQSGAG